MVSEQIQGMGRHLNSLNTTLYTIRTGASQSEWMTSADLDISSMKRDGFANVAAINASEGTKVKRGGEVGPYKDDRTPSRSIAGEMNSMERERLGVLRDSAQATNGRFFDAGMDVDTLIAGLGGELGDYYLLGFDPPDRGAGKYHKISVEVKNPAYRIGHREGFVEFKKFGEMDARERAIHLEEGFMVSGLFNELGLQAKSYILPLSNNPASVVAIRLDSAALGQTAGLGREIELVCNVVDTKGQMRFRDHRIFRHASGADLPPELWLNCEVPITSEASALYLAVRDNATGSRSTWRVIVLNKEREEGVAVLPPPILLGPSSPGELSSWSADEVGDDDNVKDPLVPAGIRLPGKPLLDNTVSQGQFASVLLTAGNLGSGFDPNTAGVSVSYAILDEAEEFYAVTPSNQRMGFLQSQDLLIISASVPLGLSPKHLGQLRIAISGLPGESPRVVHVPYRVDPFDPEVASGYEHDPRIRHIQ
jgi:hypothetical protein